MFKSVYVSAKEVKSEMKKAGVSVLRCIQNKDGVIVTVKSDIENQNKALAYFKHKKLMQSPTIEASMSNTSYSYVDYPTLRIWVKM